MELVINLKDFKFFISVKRMNGLARYFRNDFEKVLNKVSINRFKVTPSSMLSFY